MTALTALLALALTALPTEAGPLAPLLAATGDPGGGGDPADPGGAMLEPTTTQVLASYVLWIPLAVLAARDLRGEGPLRAWSVALILIVPPAGLLLWLLTREVWGRRNRESGGR